MYTQRNQRTPQHNVMLVRDLAKSSQEILLTSDIGQPKNKGKKYIDR